MARWQGEADKSALVNPLRMEAHKAFDRLWQSGHMTRDKAYVWMSRVMNLPPAKAHIKQFDVQQCALLLKFVAAHNRLDEKK